MTPEYDALPETGANGHAAAVTRIDTRLGLIEKAENERAGAARLLVWFVASFGSLGTAAVIALAGMLWSSHSDALEAHARINRLEEKAEAIESLDEENERLALRVNTLSRDIIELTNQLERQNARLDSLLTRLDEPRRR